MKSLFETFFGCCQWRQRRLLQCAWLLLVVASAVAEIMPIDCMPSVGGGTSPAIYKSSFIPGSSRVEFDDLQFELTAWNTERRALVDVPVVNTPLVIDVMVFRARYGDTCPGSTLPQCLNLDILPAHGIGINRDDFWGDVNDDDDDFLQGTAICCTADLMARGHCPVHNTLILNTTLFQGQHIQWSIPVGESKVSPTLLTNSTLSLSRGGRYMVVMASCSASSVPARNATLHDYSLSMNGHVRFKSFLGYLPLSMVGIWFLFVALFLAHVGILTWYGRQLLQQRQQHTNSSSSLQQQQHNHHHYRSLRKSEKWISFALGLGMTEALAHVVMWTMLDETGHFSMMALWTQHVLNGIKMCVSFCLGLFLAQAAGYAWHVQDSFLTHRRAKSRVPLVLGITLYSALRTVQGLASYCLFRPGLLESVSYQTGMSVAYTRIAAQQMAAFVSIVMVIWMLVAVSRTIRYFASLQTDRANRLRYVRLRFIFVVTSVASLTTFACTSMSLPFMTAYSYQSSAISGGPWMFYVSALNDVIYFVTLAGVTYLWRPRANQEEDTYLTASLLNTPVMEDVQEIDVMEFSSSFHAGAQGGSPIHPSLVSASSGDAPSEGIVLPEDDDGNNAEEQQVV